MTPDRAQLAEVSTPLLASDKRVFAAVDHGGLFNKSTQRQPEDQCDKIKDQKRFNNTAQALPKIVSADLPSASESDLTQLNQARSVWHNYRYTHRLWMCTSMLVACGSLMTQYSWGFGVLFGALGVCTAWQGLRWLHIPPEQQASNLRPFFRLQYAMGCASAAYSVLLGLTMILLEMVCLKGDLNCDRLSVSRSAAMQIGMGVGLIAHAAVSFAAARNASDVEAALNKATQLDNT